MSDKRLNVQWQVKIPKTILVEVPDSFHLSSPVRLSRLVAKKPFMVTRACCPDRRSTRVLS